MKGKTRACHETINRNMKEFKILGGVYRGDKNKHQAIFSAVAVAVQSEIMEGRGTFNIDYRIPRTVTYF